MIDSTYPEDKNLADCLDLHLAYERSIRIATKNGQLNHPVQLAEIKKYKMASKDAFIEAQMYIPRDLLSELAQSLGPRWKFRILTWRWRMVAFDEEVEKLMDLHNRWYLIK
jgi:hypothetical protein